MVAPSATYRVLLKDGWWLQVLQLRRSLPGPLYSGPIVSHLKLVGISSKTYVKEETTSSSLTWLCWCLHTLQGPAGCDLLGLSNQLPIHEQHICRYSCTDFFKGFVCSSYRMSIGGVALLSQWWRQSPCTKTNDRDFFHLFLVSYLVLFLRQRRTFLGDIYTNV